MSNDQEQLRHIVVDEHLQTRILKYILGLFIAGFVSFVVFAFQSGQWVEGIEAGMAAQANEVNRLNETMKNDVLSRLRGVEKEIAAGQLWLADERLDKLETMVFGETTTQRDKGVRR